MALELRDDNPSIESKGIAESITVYAPKRQSISRELGGQSCCIASETANRRRITGENYNPSSALRQQAGLWDKDARLTVNQVLRLGRCNTYVLHQQINAINILKRIY
jgi:hypothetical protein